MNTNIGLHLTDVKGYKWYIIESLLRSIFAAQLTSTL